MSYFLFFLLSLFIYIYNVCVYVQRLVYMYLEMCRYHKNYILLIQTCDLQLHCCHSCIQIHKHWNLGLTNVQACKPLNVLMIVYLCMRIITYRLPGIFLVLGSASCWFDSVQNCVCACPASLDASRHGTPEQTGQPLLHQVNLSLETCWEILPGCGSTCSAHDVQFESLLCSVTVCESLWLLVNVVLICADVHGAGFRQ